MTAHRAGLLGCRSCGRVWPEDRETCDRCGADLVPPDRRGLQKVWAWWAAGLIMYVPANLFPMMRTQTFAGLQGSSEATILQGVVELMHYGNYDIAIIVFVASVIACATGLCRLHPSRSCRRVLRAICCLHHAFRAKL